MIIQKVSYCRLGNLVLTKGIPCVCHPLSFCVFIKVSLGESKNSANRANNTHARTQHTGTQKFRGKKTIITHTTGNNFFHLFLLLFSLHFVQDEQVRSYAEGSLLFYFCSSAIFFLGKQKRHLIKNTRVNFSWVTDWYVIVPGRGVEMGHG